MFCRYLISFLILFLPDVLSAQDCSDFHQYHCKYTDYKYSFSEQSQSVLSGPGQTHEFSVSLKGYTEYYFSVCANRKFGKLRFRIYEDTPERKLIFDNAQSNYISTFNFENKANGLYIVEVSVPENRKIMHERRCVGVLIEEKPLEGGLEP